MKYEICLEVSESASKNFYKLSEDTKERLTKLVEVFLEDMPISNFVIDEE